MTHILELPDAQGLRVDQPFGFWALRSFPGTVPTWVVWVPLCHDSEDY